MNAPDYDLDTILALCLDFMLDWPMSPADVVAGFEDAHGLTLADDERLYITRGLAAANNTAN